MRYVYIYAHSFSVALLKECRLKSLVIQNTVSPIHISLFTHYQLLYQNDDSNMQLLL